MGYSTCQGKLLNRKVSGRRKVWTWEQERTELIKLFFLKFQDEMNASDVGVAQNICQLSKTGLDKGRGSARLWRLRPVQVFARSREAVHAYAILSRAGSGLSDGNSREIGDWEGCREEGSGVGEGGVLGQRLGSVASGLGKR